MPVSKETIDNIINSLKIAGDFIIKTSSSFLSILWTVISNLYFLYSLILLFIIWLVIWIYKEYKKWNSGWLSVLIENDISETKKKLKVGKKDNKRGSLFNKEIFPRLLNQIKLCLFDAIGIVHRYLKFKLPADTKTFYLPSVASFTLMLLVFVFIFFFTHPDVNYGNILDIDKFREFLLRSIEIADLSNVIAIIGGFVAMAFALIIFIAETIRDGWKSTEQKKFILASSYLWPIVVFTILSLLNFIWFKMAVFSLLLPIALAMAIIWSFAQTIRILIDPAFCEKNREKLFKDRLKRIVFDSVRERIGNGILLNKIGSDKELKMEYTFSKNWLDKEAGRYDFIESEKEGWLSDINITELNNLAIYLENKAKEMGFSIYQGNILQEATRRGGGVEFSQGTGKVRKVYLLKRYGEYLPPDTIFTKDSKAILALPKEFAIDPSLISYIKDRAKHIFRFKKSDPASEVFRKELQGIKDILVTAIKSVSLGSIDSLKQNYLDLAETFLETLHDFGGGFSSEQAKKERGNIFDGWNEVRWLERDIRELLIVASSTDNRDVISDIAFLPISIAIRAVQARDHYLFQQFVSYSTFLYFLTKDKPDGELKSFMIERSWRYLKELSDLYIEPQFNSEEGVGDLKEYEDFAIYIFRIFQSLLKAAFDRGDLKTFVKIAEEFSRLYRHFDPKNDHPNADYLESALKWSRSEKEKQDIQIKLERQHAKEISAKKIKLAQKQVFFGLAAKILDKFNQNQANAKLKDFFEAVAKYISDDVVSLTEIFDASRNFETEEHWGWDDWEVVADGEVHWIDVEGKLDRLYCVMTLRILKNQNEEQINKIKIKPSRNLAFLSEEKSGTKNLMTILDSINSEPSQWAFVLDGAAISKIAALEEILRKAHEEQEKNEEEYLKSVKVDPEKLNEFKDKVEKSFKQSGHLRPLLIALNAYNDSTNEVPKKKYPSWGYNQISEKAAFIKDWHVSYVGWGDNFGEGMARSEDQLIFEAMINGAGDEKNVQKQDIISEIEKELKNNKFTNPVLLQTFSRFYEYDYVKKADQFLPRYDRDCPKTKFDNILGYLGILKIDDLQVPVVEVFVSKEESRDKAILADFSDFGVLDQFSPIDDPADAQ
ncbi:MAG: hypothetical protein WC926_03305, partial [Candidatus Paceibacterota bacterium]